MHTLKKIGICLGVLIWAGGIVGGLVLSIAAKSPVMVASIVVLGAFSFPTVKRLLTKND